MELFSMLCAIKIYDVILCDFDHKTRDKLEKKRRAAWTTEVFNKFRNSQIQKQQLDIAEMSFTRPYS